MIAVLFIFIFEIIPYKFPGHNRSEKLDGRVEYKKRGNCNFKNTIPPF